jgi:hypothetical protein
VIIDTILPSSLKRNARKWLAYKYREARETGLRAAVLRTGQRVWQRYRDGSVLSPGVGLESMGDSNDVRLQIYSMAAGAYVKTDHGYAGSTLVIRALDSMDMVTFDVDTDLGWSRHVRGPLRVFEAPGDHLGTLREQDTGDIVRREIEEVRRHLKTAQSSSTR